MHLTEDEALLVETVTIGERRAKLARGEATGIPVNSHPAELGLLAIKPRNKGGAGLGLRDLGLVVGHLAQGDPGLARALARHNQALAILNRPHFKISTPI